MGLRRGRRADKPAPGIAELGDAPWHKHDRDIADATLWRMLSVLPGTFALILRLAWRVDRRALVSAAGAQVVSGALMALGVLAVADVLEVVLAVISTAEGLGAALPPVAFATAVYAARGLVDVAATAATERLSPQVMRQAEHELIRAAARVELVRFDHPEFHDRLERARYRGVNQIEPTTDLVVTLFGQVVSLVSTAGMMGVLHPLLLPVLVLSVVPEAWAALESSRRDYRSVLGYVHTRRRFAMIMDLFADRDSAAEVRAFGARDTLLSEHERLGRAMEAEQRRVARANGWTQLAGRSMAGLGLAASYLTLGWLLHSGAVSLAVAAAATVAIRIGRGALTQATVMASRLFGQGLYINDFAGFVAEPGRRTRAATTTAPADPAVLECRDVRFTYPGSPEEALRGVSLRIAKGQKIALVGENGSGKSTLAKLLAGLYHPDHGAIRWDGVDLADVEEDSIADRVAVVMQNPTRWPLTLRENVTLGRPDRPDPGGAALAAAAADAGVDSIAADLPNGWDTLLTKHFRDGQDLSGGQWQRVSVARALYRDAPVLICDEPTAALDARAEAAVYESLRLLGSGRTMVLITHRLASVRNADLIIVLRRGEVVEQGTHDELMAAGGHYAELFELQAAAYRDAPSARTSGGLALRSAEE